MKAKIDNIYAIFLLKKNVRSDIIKTILRYLPISAPKTLKEWKIAIISVKQGYEYTKSWYNYRTGTGITCEGRGISMEIRKFKDNYDKEEKPRFFNCNIYGHITKDC